MVRLLALLLVAALGAGACADRECEVLDVICVETCGEAEFLQCTTCPEGTVDALLCPSPDDGRIDGCATAVSCDLTCPAGEACVCDDPATPSGCVPARCTSPDDCPLGLRCELARTATSDEAPAALRCRTALDSCRETLDCPSGSVCTTPDDDTPWACIPEGA